MPPQNLTERTFEKHIFDKLHDLHGYKRRKDDEHYNRNTALDEVLVIKFIKTTQPEAYSRAKEQWDEEVQEKIISILSRDLNKRGVVDVLRKGIDVPGSEGVEKVNLIYFKPENDLNPDAQALYEKNIFSAMRQVHFNPRTEQSLDLVLFINGIPVATSELKNELTGQDISHAVNQYKVDRDPDLPIFTFKRCAAHFAVDTSEVQITTHLKKEGTYFLPFNKGNKNGAGNPPSEEGKHKTAYLWEDVWAPDSWLDLIHHFVHVFKEYSEDEDGNEHAKWIQAFPRFHQRKSVNDLVRASKGDGAGSNYLVHHSAGSGKSMTIAWTAFRLSELHDDQGELVFDSVIVLTDRRILNKQLGETVKAFEQQRGVLARIGEQQTSADLKLALERGAKIITTTIHKFGVIKNAIGELPGKKFALIVDEAHSSQSGEMRRAVHEVLGRNREYENMEEWVNNQAQNRLQPGTLSYYAFTATPREETLEKFGIRKDDGKFYPFSLYSMKQAIEEGFILDVLANYTTYKTHFDLIQSAEDDPNVKKRETIQKLVRFVRKHENVIERNVAILMEHFDSLVKDKLQGKEKAMIVTDSRDSAVLYQLAVKKYIEENNLPYKSLVAFTDTVKIDGQEYTESNMNGLPDSKTAKTFKKKDYKFLIVAEKYQTGFDEPLLCAMYVIKTLSGVSAVQTLSRLNRSHRGKKNVYVLDFVNSFEDIQDAFEPYYTSTILGKGVDIGLVGDTSKELNDLFKIDDEELDKFSKILSEESDTHGRHELVNAFLDNLAQEIKESLLDEEFKQYKTKAHFYIWLYAYVAQVVSYVDIKHEKYFLLLFRLVKKLKKGMGEKGIDVEQYVDLQSLKVVKGLSGSIALDEAIEELEQEIDIPEPAKEDEIVSLSSIVEGMNQKWGTEFGDKQKETLNEMSEGFAEDDEMKGVIKSPYNTRSHASIVFDHKFDDKVNETYGIDDKLWEQLMNNEDLKAFVQKEMFKHVFSRVLAEENEVEEVV